MHTCRRRQPRYRLGPNSRAVLEFRFPEGENGQDLRLVVADLSASGLGFILDGSMPGMDLGTGIKGATLCYGERRIAMDLLVLHVTQDFAADAICGCLVYPASDTDLRGFKDLLAEMAGEHASVTS
ncbi:MAG TPA: hypothetical protein VFV75_05870 [Candidatus Polarisedimenticolaceae bacterium]|nr:hypothetical protein [Candidatus Polarisedimenticolaceae bacterium]